MYLPLLFAVFSLCPGCDLHLQEYWSSSSSPSIFPMWGKCGAWGSPFVLSSVGNRTYVAQGNTFFFHLPSRIRTSTCITNLSSLGCFLEREKITTNQRKREKFILTASSLLPRRSQGQNAWAEGCVSQRTQNHTQLCWKLTAKRYFCHAIWAFHLKPQSLHRHRRDAEETSRAMQRCCWISTDAASEVFIPQCT